MTGRAAALAAEGGGRHSIQVTSINTRPAPGSVAAPWPDRQPAVYTPGAGGALGKKARVE